MVADAVINNQLYNMKELWGAQKTVNSSLFAKLPRLEDSQETLQSSSQAATNPAVCHHGGGFTLPIAAEH